MTPSKPERKSAGIGKGTPGPGRGRGNPNKLTKALKEMILGALHDAGGQKYLLAQAEREPRAFLALLGRIVPSEVHAELTGKDGEPLLPIIYMPANGRDQQT